jgi:serine O-acetyltransferase
MTRFFVKIFGGFNRIRNSANTTSNPLKRFLLIRIYNAYCISMGSSIDLKAVFKSNPVFPHGIFGIFISQQAQIGENCVIFHQVTIGSNTLSDSKSRGAPVIGDNCYIGAGAKIIGNVVIGNNVRIGANCVVFKDIPDNHVVVCQAPRLIFKESQNNEFIKINDVYEKCIKS